jgi:ring-1,2-phenylacetyl-CoA epoxidase subunit PaaD
MSKETGSRWAHVEEPLPRGERPRCPFCGSTETELFSLFGQQLLTAQYYCNRCHTPFEYIKGDDVLEDAKAKLTSSEE